MSDLKLPRVTAYRDRRAMLADTQRREREAAERQAMTEVRRLLDDGISPVDVARNLGCSVRHMYRRLAVFGMTSGSASGEQG